MKKTVFFLLFALSSSLISSVVLANGKCGDNACQDEKGKCWPKEKHVSCTKGK